MCRILCLLSCRYDKEGVGAVKKLHLFGLLGLDNVGFLPVTSTKDVIINSRSNTAGDKVRLYFIATWRLYL